MLLSCNGYSFHVLKVICVATKPTSSLRAENMLLNTAEPSPRPLKSTSYLKLNILISEQSISFPSLGFSHLISAILAVICSCWNINSWVLDILLWKYYFFHGNFYCVAKINCPLVVLMIEHKDVSIVGKCSETILSLILNSYLYHIIIF